MLVLWYFLDIMRSCYLLLLILLLSIPTTATSTTTTVYLWCTHAEVMPEGTYKFSSTAPRKTSN